MILLPDDRRAEIARLPVEPAQGQSLASLLGLHRVALRQLLAVEASLRQECSRLEAVIALIEGPFHVRARRAASQALRSMHRGKRAFICPKCRHRVRVEKVEHEETCRGTLHLVDEAIHGHARAPQSDAEWPDEPVAKVRASLGRCPKCHRRILSDNIAHLEYCEGQLHLRRSERSA